MKKYVDLHPKANGGEKALAKIIFEERMMTLEILTQSYGRAATRTCISFDHPDDVLSLSNALKELAYEAIAEFKKNP